MSETIPRQGEPETRICDPAKAEEMAYAGKAERELASSIKEVARVEIDYINYQRESEKNGQHLNYSDMEEWLNTIKEAQGKLYPLSYREQWPEGQDALPYTPSGVRYGGENREYHDNHSFTHAARLMKDLDPELDVRQTANRLVDEAFDETVEKREALRGEQALGLEVRADLVEDAAGRIYDSGVEFDANDLVRLERYDIPKWERELDGYMKLRDSFTEDSFGEILFADPLDDTDFEVGVLRFLVSRQLDYWLSYEAKPTTTLAEVRQKTVELCEAEITRRIESAEKELLEPIRHFQN